MSRTDAETVTIEVTEPQAHDIVNLLADYAIEEGSPDRWANLHADVRDQVRGDPSNR